MSNVNETIIYLSVYLKAEINELVESILLFLFQGLKQRDSTEGQHKLSNPLQNSSPEGQQCHTWASLGDLQCKTQM